MKRATLCQANPTASPFPTAKQWPPAPSTKKVLPGSRASTREPAKSRFLSGTRRHGRTPDNEELLPFMAEEYTVEQGDCMSSIAYGKGFFWQTLWNLSENAALKAKRKNPNVLMTGDVVHIRDLTVRKEPGATEKTHKFILNGVPEKLRIKMLDVKHKPRANLDYIIVIDGDARRGKTNI